MDGKFPGKLFKALMEKCRFLEHALPKANSSAYPNKAPMKVILEAGKETGLCEKKELCNDIYWKNSVTLL